MTNELIEILDMCSVENSIGVRLDECRVSDLNTDMLGRLYKDLQRIEEASLLIVGVSPFRVKSKSSILSKVEKYKDTDYSLQHVFKDILACRNIVEKYPVPVENDNIRSYVRDYEVGYRAVHYLYTKSSYHYPIEVQYWLKKDELFNALSHKYLYKPKRSKELCIKMRNIYDTGLIKTEEDFVRCLKSM